VPPAPAQGWTPGRPPGDASPRPRPLVVAGLVVLGLLVVALVAAIVDRADGDETVAPPSTIDLSDPEITAPPSEEPIVPIPSDPFPIPDELDPDALARPLAEVLPELIDFVERVRGQEFVTEPDVQAVPDDEFVDALRQASEGEDDELRRAQVASTATGVIDPGTDLVDLNERAGAVGVLGFYDPATEELYVKGDVVTPLVQTVIVHELVHALDDQVFDLGRLDVLAARDDETAFGFIALVEGTARWVEEQFRNSLDIDEQTAVIIEETEIGLAQSAALASVPVPFLVQQQVPYGSGSAFVAALADGGGTAAVDAAYRDPPTTSEQILDPDAFARSEPATEVPGPAADGVPVEQGAFGAADLRLLEVVADPYGGSFDGRFEPFEGFGGGRYVSWEDDGRRCVRIVVEADSERGSVEISEIASSWAASLDGATVSQSGPPASVRFTLERCARG